MPGETVLSNYRTYPDHLRFCKQTSLWTYLLHQIQIQISSPTILPSVSFNASSFSCVIFICAIALTTEGPSCWKSKLKFFISLSASFSTAISMRNSSNASFLSSCSTFCKLNGISNLCVCQFSSVETVFLVCLTDAVPNALSPSPCWPLCAKIPRAPTLAQTSHLIFLSVVTESRGWDFCQLKNCCRSLHSTGYSWLLSSSWSDSVSVVAVDFPVLLLIPTRDSDCWLQVATKSPFHVCLTVVTTWLTTTR